MHNFNGYLHLTTRETCSTTSLCLPQPRFPYMWFNFWDKNVMLNCNPVPVPKCVWWENMTLTPDWIHFHSKWQVLILSRRHSENVRNVVFQMFWSCYLGTGSLPINIWKLTIRNGPSVNSRLRTPAIVPLLNGVLKHL